MSRPLVRPLVLLAALVPVHLGGQLVLLGRVVPALLVLPLLAVAAYEAAHAAADRWSVRNGAAHPAGTPTPRAAAVSHDEERQG